MLEKRGTGTTVLVWEGPTSTGDMSGTSMGVGIR